MRNVTRRIGRNILKVCDTHDIPYAWPLAVDVTTGSIYIN